MKQFFFGVVVLGLMVVSVPSLAADIKPYNWTGFYVGINGGYGWGKTNWDYDGFTTKADHTFTGGWLVEPSAQTCSYLPSRA